MPPDGEEMIAFRLSPRDRAAIQRLVEVGEFRNRSDFLRYAVKAALREFDVPRGHPPMDLELEGVALPEPGESARSSRGAPRARKGVSL